MAATAEWTGWCNRSGLSFRTEAPPRAGLLFLSARPRHAVCARVRGYRRDPRVKLSAPPGLPAALRARFERVADLGEIDPGWSSDVAATAGRVVSVSDFALGILRRFPRWLAARVADRAPLTRETLEASLSLESRSEADAMAE